MNVFADKKVSVKSKNRVMWCVFQPSTTNAAKEKAFQQIDGNKHNWLKIHNNSKSWMNLTWATDAKRESNVYSINFCSELSFNVYLKSDACKHCVVSSSQRMEMFYFRLFIKGNQLFGTSKIFYVIEIKILWKLSTVEDWTHFLFKSFNKFQELKFDLKAVLPFLNFLFFSSWS